MIRSSVQPSWAFGLMLVALTSRARATDPSPVGMTAAADAPVVTVEGERSKRRFASRDPSAASTVLSGDALRGAGQSAAAALAQVPGVQVARSGAQSDLATASIRGSTANEVPVYVAGIRINDDVSGTADLSTIPLWMMDRVEVFRGNAPAHSEQLGLGGAIFFWPRSPSAPRLAGGVGVGSFGARQGWLALETGGDGTGALVAVRREQARNDYAFANDQGQRFDVEEREERRKNADFVAHDAWTLGRFRLSRATQLTTVLNTFRREQGVTGFSVIPALTTRASVQRVLAGATLSTACAASGCRAEVQASLLDAGLSLHNPTLELPALGTTTLHDAGRRGSARANVAFALPGIELGVGLAQSFETLRVDRVGNLPRKGRRATSQASLSGTLLAFDGWVLHALGALECHGTRSQFDRLGRALTSDSGTCGVLEPVARFGASYRVARSMKMLANLGRYVRVPTLGELYGSSPLVQGNPSLLPEQGVSFDLGVRGIWRSRGTAYGLDVFGFVRRASNLIRFRTTGLKTAAPFNVGNARILGAEALLFGEWWRAVRLESAWTALDARDTTKDRAAAPTVNRMLPLAARLVAWNSLTLSTEPALGGWRPRRLALSFIHLYRASRYADPAGQVVLPAQNTLDVELSSSHFADALTASLAFRNAFDARQLDLIGLPVPGRSVHAELQAGW